MHETEHCNRSHNYSFDYGKAECEDGGDELSSLTWCFSPTTTCPMSHAVKMAEAIHANVIVVVYSRFLRDEGENVRIDSI